MTTTTVAEVMELAVGTPGVLDVVVSAGAEAPTVRPSAAPRSTADATLGRRPAALPEPPVASVDELLARYERLLRRKVADGTGKEATFEAYLVDTRQHLQWLADRGLLCFGRDGTELLATVDDLEEYRSWLIGQYAVSTVGRKLASLRRFYQLAQGQGIVPTNPTTELRAPKDPTEPHSRVKWYPEAVIQRLLAAPAQNDPKGIRDRTMMVMMAIHGLRECEVCRARLADLDLEAGEAGELVVVGKRDKMRVIHLVPETREELKRWLAVRRMMHTEAPELFVSMHWGGDPAQRQAGLSTRGVREMVDGYLVKVGVKAEGKSGHALRHSFATNSLLLGANLYAISKMLGHASITTTQVYADLVITIQNNPASFLTGALRAE